MDGRVIWPGGLAPTIMAGTHGYGFGCVLVYEESKAYEPRAGRHCEVDKGAVL